VHREIDDRRAHDPGFELVDVDSLSSRLDIRPHGLIEPVHQPSRRFRRGTRFSSIPCNRLMVAGAAANHGWRQRESGLADVGPFRLGFAASSALPSRLASVMSTIATRSCAWLKELPSTRALIKNARRPKPALDLDLVVIDVGLGLDRDQKFSQSRHVEMPTGSQQVSPDQVLGFD